MREKGLGKGESVFTALLNTVVELVHVKGKLFAISVVQLAGHQGGSCSWVKIE